MTSTRVSKVHRSDVDGLRAVAILLVVFFHVGVKGVRGGFIGVDVFFVISGYLITRKLLAEATSSGSVRLGRFWAGRVRRLVPALAVVTAVVLSATLVVLSPLEWSRAARDSLFSTLYVSNIVYAAQSANYFASDVNTSLFLHTWSLAVEEQFYLVWPLVVFVGVRLTRSSPGSTKKALGVVFFLMSILSFGYAVFLTRRGNTWSFYGLPTRAWEFAVAGMLACVEAWVVARRASLPRFIAPGLAGAGLVLIVVAGLRMDSFTPHPGMATLMPVFGALFVIGAGIVTLDGPVGRLLSAGVVQWIGRVSYSWYLWHWPAIKLAVALSTNEFVPRLAGAVIGLAIAAVSLRFVENPIRYRPSLMSSTKRSLAFGLAATLLVAGLAFGLDSNAKRALDDPFFARLTAVGSAPACQNVVLPDGRSLCVYGDPGGGRTVVLYGDSHAIHWLPGLDTAAKKEGVRLIAQTHQACPSTGVFITIQGMKAGQFAICERFYAESDTLIAKIRPSAVIFANGPYFGRITDSSGKVLSKSAQIDAWRDGVRNQLQKLKGQGIGVGWIFDNPDSVLDPNTCIARRRTTDGCTTTRSEATAALTSIRDAETAELNAFGGVKTFDITNVICPDSECRLEVDGSYVYVDTNHLRPDFVLHQVDDLAAFVRSLSAPA